MATPIYGSVANADAYHLERGNAAWAPLTTDQKTAALVRASAYIDGLSGLRRSPGGCVPVFPGKKAGGRTQERQWPRTGATDKSGEAIPDDEIPLGLVHATYEAALREATAPGSLSPDYIAAEQIKREKVGPLETEYRDASDSGAGSVMPVVPVIDALLGDILWCRAGMIGVMVV